MFANYLLQFCRQSTLTLGFKKRMQLYGKYSIIC